MKLFESIYLFFFKKWNKRAIRSESIAYHNWVVSLNKSGFPKNKDGTAMDCWQLYDYYEENKRSIYLMHAIKYDHKK